MVPGEPRMGREHAPPLAEAKIETGIPVLGSGNRAEQSQMLGLAGRMQAIE